MQGRCRTINTKRPLAACQDRQLGLVVMCEFFDDEGEVAAHLVAITFTLCLRELRERSGNLSRPSYYQLGRDDQRAIVRTLALVVYVLLPVRPAFVFNRGQTVDERFVLEDRSKVRI